MIMREKEKSLLSDCGFGLTAAGEVFTCSLAAAACLSLNVYYALVTAVVCLAASAGLKNKVLSPNAFLLVPLIFVVGASGLEGLPFAVLGAALLSLLISFSKEKLSPPSCVKVGAAFGLAFSVTALLTTYYFGIGAGGASTLEILKNYRYLGFHPNWRGVFYGTITLFSMITYPFKFRRLSKYLPKEVVSVAIPFFLNLFLNPDKDATPILEVGSLSDMSALLGLKSFLPFTDFSALSSGNGAIGVLKGAFALAVLFAAFDFEEKRDRFSSLGGSAASGLLGGFPATAREILRYRAPSAVTACVVTAALCVLFPSLLARVPLHSLSVVFIVAAWQAVPFGRAAKIFKERKFVFVAAFFMSALSFVFFDVFTAAVVCVLLSVVLRSVKK